MTDQLEMTAEEYQRDIVKDKRPKWHKYLDKQLVELFGDQLQREYVFHEPEEGQKKRRWRFDYAIPALRIAVEFDGVVSNAAHTSVENVLNDSAKHNTAQLQGWLVIRTNSPNIRDGSALRFVRRAINLRERGS